MSQTRVTPSSGRMSRTDAYDALQSIRAIARTFPGHPQAAEIYEHAQTLSDALYGPDLQPGTLPAKTDILSLQDALNALVAERLLRSERISPTVSPAVTVFLYGSESADTTRAFSVASQALQTTTDRLALVDVSPHQTDRLTGQRYTIRSVPTTAS